jgi:hypothetical protein
MSLRNGDRARFQKNRKRKLLHRQRVHALVKASVPQTPPAPAAAKTAEQK